MTKTEKAVSWGLTGFFGLICLAAAPQVSVGFFIKYGILSGALGFGITAISSAVGKAFPDDGYTYHASGSRTVHHHHHHDDSDYTPPRQNNWYLFGLGNNHSSRSTPSDDGRYVGSRREPVSTPLYPSTPLSNASNGTYVGSRTEPVIPSYRPSAPPSNTGHGTYVGSRTEKVNSYTPSANSNAGSGFFAGFTSFGDSSPSTGLSSGTHVGTRYEPI